MKESIKQIETFWKRHITLPIQYLRLHDVSNIKTIMALKQAFSGNYGEYNKILEKVITDHIKFRANYDTFIQMLNEFNYILGNDGKQTLIKFLNGNEHDLESLYGTLYASIIRYAGTIDPKVKIIISELDKRISKRNTRVEYVRQAWKTGKSFNVFPSSSSPDSTEDNTRKSLIIKALKEILTDIRSACRSCQLHIASVEDLQNLDGLVSDLPVERNYSILSRCNDKSVIARVLYESSIPLGIIFDTSDEGELRSTDYIGYGPDYLLNLDEDIECIIELLYLYDQDKVIIKRPTKDLKISLLIKLFKMVSKEKKGMKFSEQTQFYIRELIYPLSDAEKAHILYLKDINQRIDTTANQMELPELPSIITSTMRTKKYSDAKSDVGRGRIDKPRRLEKRGSDVSLKEHVWAALHTWRDNIKTKELDKMVKANPILQILQILNSYRSKSKALNWFKDYLSNNKNTNVLIKCLSDNDVKRELSKFLSRLNNNDIQELLKTSEQSQELKDILLECAPQKMRLGPLGETRERLRKGRKDGTWPNQDSEGTEESIDEFIKALKNDVAWSVSDDVKLEWLESKLNPVKETTSLPHDQTQEGSVYDWPIITLIVMSMSSDKNRAGSIKKICERMGKTLGDRFYFVTTMIYGDDDSYGPISDEKWRRYAIDVVKEYTGIDIGTNQRAN